jgi:Carboxypeptidase regulatory-like domain
VRRTLLLVIGVASLAGCGNSATSPVAPTTPSSAAPLPIYSLTGIVTDAVRHTPIAGARVELTAVGGVNNQALLTDNAGNYTIEHLVIGSYRVRASVSGYDSREQVVDLIQGARADFALPLAANGPNYYGGVWGGTWEGVYDVSDCHQIAVPGLIDVPVCPSSPQHYSFSLAQIGTFVSGGYQLLSPFYDCACQRSDYGQFNMGGSVSADGTLLSTASGTVPLTGGVTARLDFVLWQPSSTTMAGAGTMHFRFNSLDDRGFANVVIRTGTRVRN